METKLTLHISPRNQQISCSELLDRLRERLIARIRNGEITERGLARQLGLSQPYVHNFLKGARGITPEVADRILSRLNLSVLDLVEDARPAAPKPPAQEVPRRASRAASR